MKEVQKMKKSNLITGILYVLFGVVCLIVALLIETKLEGILWGFAGAGIFPGIMMICKYFYWSSPKNKEQYEERLENDRIEQHDELKTKIRDRAGRYAYGIGLVVICFSILVFSILGALEVIDNARMIILYLSGYLMFQIITGKNGIKKNGSLLYTIIPLQEVMEQHYEQQFNALERTTERRKAQAKLAEQLGA